MGNGERGMGNGKNGSGQLKMINKSVISKLDFENIEVSGDYNC